MHTFPRYGRRTAELVGFGPLTIGRVSDWSYAGDDFYCDLAVPRACELEVVFQDEHVLAFHHTRPFWSTHIVVVPKRHLASLTTVGPGDEFDIRALLSAVQRVARDVEKTTGAAGVLTNLGRYQDSKHLHIHVYSGDKLS